MLYPNLQINISKHKRTANGLEDASANLINTPVILDLAVQMSDEKSNSFAFSHQPSLNQFKQDQEKHISLQTPILEINNHTPFFQNQNSLAISPGDNLNDFVAPNEILNTFTSANSTSTSTTTNANLSLNSNTYDLNQQHQLTLITDLNDQQLNQLNTQQQKLIQLTKQESNNLPDYSNHFTLTSSNVPSYTQQQLNQYNSNLLNQQQQQQNDLNDNLSTITLNSHLTQDQQQHHNLTYTELKPSNQQQLLIPNSVYDISGFNKKIPSTSTLQTNYLSPSSPAESISSHTSSSNLDNADLFSYMGSSSTLKNDCSTSRGRRYGQMSSNEKKSRLTKKQKYDQMLNEEKNLLKNNDQLKDDIKNLEDLIIKYKKTIMNTVKNNK